MDVQFKNCFNVVLHITLYFCGMRSKFCIFSMGMGVVYQVLLSTGFKGNLFLYSKLFFAIQIHVRYSTATLTPWQQDLMIPLQIKVNYKI